MNKLLVGLTVSLLAHSAIAQCITASGTLVGNTPDSIYPAVPIGFAFPLNGVTYTDIHCSDHGICFLSNGGVPAPPVATPLVYNVLLSDLVANGPVLAPFWADHTTGTAGAVWIDHPSSTQCVLKWVDVQTFPSQLPAFSFQMTLDASGSVDLAFDANADNYGSTFAANAIVGATSGAGATLPASSDLSMTGVTLDPTVYEEFTAPNDFDLTGQALQLLPASPGWVWIPQAGPCARKETYGRGCVSGFGSFYQLFANATTASAGLSNQSLSLTPTSTGYVAVWGGATFVPPTAGTPLSPGDDGDVAYMPSIALPTPFGPQSTLQVSGNAIITFGTFPPSFPVGPPWVPNASDFLGNGGLYAWHDYNVTEGGQILAEEIGGVLYITYDNVDSYPFGTPNLSTLQFQLDLNNGNLAIVWLTVDNDPSSAFGSGHLVGLTPPGMSLDPGSINLATQLPLVTEADMAGLALDSNPPVLGSGWNLTTSNIDPASPISITFFGDARLDPGLPLTFIGLPAPGCSVYINTILGNLVGFNVAGASTVTLPIPGTMSLTGAIVTAQSISLTTLNAANLLTSNGVEGRLGR